MPVRIRYSISLILVLTLCAAICLGWWVDRRSVPLSERLLGTWQAEVSPPSSESVGLQLEKSGRFELERLDKTPHGVQVTTYVGEYVVDDTRRQVCFQFENVRLPDGTVKAFQPELKEFLMAPLDCVVDRSRTYIVFAKPPEWVATMGVEGLPLPVTRLQRRN